MTAKAYAKINLGLHIVGKRTDGFHDIETIFHRINLFDELTIERADTLSLTCTDATIPSGSENLCWKAAELLRNESGLSYGASIAITKNIPTGAGLGGGSSDAASVLRILNELWGLSLSLDVLHRLALRLGSDVPYFLQNGTAYAEGRGERLTSMDLQLPFWIVLVNPNIHISTPWAYQRLAETRNGQFPMRTPLRQSIGTDPVRGILDAQNDFESIVFNEHPVIGSIKTDLKRFGAVLALMSGSGSTMFGLFEEKIAAMNAVQFFSKEYFVHMTEPFFTPERNA